MPKLKLTKTLAEGAQPEAKDYDIRDTVTPGFLLKMTPSGRKMFMLAYTAANGQRRKHAIGRFGEITVEQARSSAQDWLAEVRRGNDQSTSAPQREPLRMSKSSASGSSTATRLPATSRARSRATGSTSTLISSPRSVS